MRSVILFSLKIIAFLKNTCACAFVLMQTQTFRHLQKVNTQRVLWIEVNTEQVSSFGTALNG